ncbi:MAG TPA: aminopeptidase [Vicinamibacterales bacterium]|jgi:aminopeptidase|nr:aminopeptidase [Vicinamibacterales bacterium]
MPLDLERALEAYGELAIKIGLNLRAGQRLLIIGPLANGGVALQAAPLVRQIAASAYRAGAPLVEAVWGDEPLQLVRFSNAPRDSFDQYSNWFPRALQEHVEAGHAVLSISANDPDHLRQQPAELIGALQRATARSVRPFRELISRNATNWTIVAAGGAGWAAKVFPDRAPAEQLSKLWDAIIRLCRLDRPDPVAAWHEHLANLVERRDFLNRKKYEALKYRGPGTELTLGLPAGHIWVSGQSTSRNGILFAPNLPTEEVFTIAHKDRVDGTVRSTKPLSHGGTLIENFSLRFEAGRVVDIKAAKGEAMLRQLVGTDEGAARLGEVALVPHSSPVAASGLLFYNTLFDENAASHVALGSAYRFTLADGEAMPDEEFERAGGNRSAVHTDFMIGSAELDVDGVLPDGRTEPLMRRGEWAQK